MYSDTRSPLSVSIVRGKMHNLEKSLWQKHLRLTHPLVISALSIVIFKTCI